MKKVTKTFKHQQAACEALATHDSDEFNKLFGTDDSYGDADYAKITITSIDKLKNGECVEAVVEIEYE